MSHHDRRGEWVPERAIGVFTRRSATGTLIETYHDGYEVNESGAFIWSLVGGGLPVSGIAERLARRYSLDHEQALDVVESFLTEARDRGFISTGPAAVSEDAKS